MTLSGIDLTGKICLVTGGSRGIGKGIAVQLAVYGANCYVTGRNSTTLGVLSKDVEASCGTGRIIAVQCDHEDDKQVEQVFERINRENDGQFDLLVNNAYSGVQFIIENIKKKFWELPPETYDVINNVGLRNHYMCAIHASKLMIKNRRGLIINISSIGGMRYFLSSCYGIGKAGVDKMSRDCALELKKYNVAIISLWPGIVRTESLTEAVESGNEVLAPVLSRIFDRAETPGCVGRSVVALLSETQTQVMTKTGKIILTGDVVRTYGITNENGLVPAHNFQLNKILRLAGYQGLASYIPDFLKIPFCIIRMAEAWKQC